MAGTGDEIAAGAGDRGRLQASHADREQVIHVLKAAFVQGRLTRTRACEETGEGQSPGFHSPTAGEPGPIRSRPALGRGRC